MLPNYVIERIKEMNCCPPPCADIVPNTKILETAAHKIVLALRADHPEITDISFYLFSDDVADEMGIDGNFQYLDPIKPVIGVRAGCFGPDADKDYQAFLLLHECAHRLQPREDKINGLLNHGAIFQGILDNLIKLYNKKYGTNVIDWESVRTDGEKPLYRH